MILVGADHSIDLVAIFGLAEGGEAGEETSNFQHHLSAIVRKEVNIGGGLKISTYVVNDGDIDVNLPMRVVRNPPS